MILGIDPGTHRCGYGIVERRGNRFVHVAHGVIRAPAKAELPERLTAVATGLEEVLRAHPVTAVAIESVFFHRDVHAALTLGHARGVAMLVAARAGLSVAEYSPAVVKRAVSGSGKAEKAQVSAMIRAMLGLSEMPGFDATDALAIAICHASGKGVLDAIAAARAATPTVARLRRRR